MTPTRSIALEESKAHVKAFTKLSMHVTSRLDRRRKGHSSGSSFTSHHGTKLPAKTLALVITFTVVGTLLVIAIAWWWFNRRARKEAEDFERQMEYIRNSGTENRVGHTEDDLSEPPAYSVSNDKTPDTGTEHTENSVPTYDPENHNAQPGHDHNNTKEGVTQSLPIARPDV